VASRAAPVPVLPLTWLGEPKPARLDKLSGWRGLSLSAAG
jgi:hypothetical protein